MEMETLDHVIQTFVSVGADPQAKTKRGQSAFHVMMPKNVEVVMKNPHFQALDINERDEDGFTPLHLTCQEEEYVGYLLANGADPTIKSNNGMSPLHCAAKAGEACTVYLLIAQYRSLSILSREINELGDGKTPLHYACQSGSQSTVSVLLSAGAGVNIMDEDGLAPLHVLSRFIPNKPEFDYNPMISRTPEIVRLLLRYGADVEARTTSSSPTVQDTERLTALDLAVQAKRWELVRELMRCGARVPKLYTESEEFTCNTDPEVALTLAQQMKSNLEAETAALSREELYDRRYHHHPWRGRWSCKYEYNAKVPGWILGPDDLFTSNKNQSRSEIPDTEEFMAALTEFEFDIVKAYCERGGKVFESPEDIGELMQSVLAEGYEYMLKYLVEDYLRRKKPIQPGCREYKKRPRYTLLGTACSNPYPSVDIIKWLVNEVGVDIDGQHRKVIRYEESSDTPLHILARGSSFWHLAALEFLISKGANIESRNSEGVTPLFVALNDLDHPGRWKADVARILLKSGSKLDLVGKPILHLIQDPQMVLLLTSFGADLTRHADTLSRNIIKSMLPGTVEALLDAGVDPNQVPSDESYYSDSDSDLDKRKKDIEPVSSVATYENGYALHEAASKRFCWYSNGHFRERQVAVLELLFSYGADPYLTYEDGSFILQQIVRDRGAAIECLTAMKAHKLNVRGRYDRTLLIEASIPSSGRSRSDECDRRSKEEKESQTVVMTDVVKLLLELGADTTLVDNLGRTALHWMCTQKVTFDAAGKKTFTELIARCMTVLNQPDNDGHTPISLALQSYSSHELSMDFAVRQLMNAGADTSIVHPISGDCALHYVARWLAKDEPEHTAEAKALFEELATSLDINARNNAGESVIATALSAPFPTTKTVYLNCYADGRETIHAEVIEYLVGLGADVKTIDKKGRSLLHVNVERPINGKRDNSWMEKDMIANAFIALQDLGLDPYLEDNDMRSPIDIAVVRNFYNVLELFGVE